MSMFCQTWGTELVSQFRFFPSCGGRESNAYRPPGAARVGQAAAGQQLPAAPLTSTSTFKLPAAPAVASGRDADEVFWRRLMAYLVDMLLLWALFFSVGIVLAVAAPGVDVEQLEPLVTLLSVLVFWLYCANLESGPQQATPGKRLLGLRVADEHSRRISFARASGRFFAKFFSGISLSLGFLIGFTAKRQGLHGKVPSALVLRLPK